MKPTLLLLCLALVSCATGPAGSPNPRGEVVYRYVNTLDFGKDNTLDAVSVTGFDETGVKEATCLEVKIAGSSLILRDPYEGADGPMYNPAVELKPDGALLVRWEQMGEIVCRAEVVAGSDGKLIERRRTKTS